MSIRIIAEAGVNHNGNIETAKQMIVQAYEAGADYVKFQTFVPKNMVTDNAKTASYQQTNTGIVESQMDMLNKLALTQEDFVYLKKYCEEVGIGFLSTPFDFESIDFLEMIGMDFWKIPSGEITNLPYLERIGKTQKPIVLSTGISYMEEVEAAVNVLKSCGSCDITLLQCNTEYPTLYSDVNLRAMITMSEKFGLPVGYSDHTMGIEVAIAAAAMGATVIEKHFTLDRTMPGPDHKASLEPQELEDLVTSVRNIELAMGNGQKVPSQSELPNKNFARKSIVAKRMIRKDEVFTEENITIKRPGTGVSPMKWHEVLGQKAIREFREDEFIEL